MAEKQAATSLNVQWNDPDAFPDALTYQMQKHEDSYRQLHKAIVKPNETFDVKTIKVWQDGKRYPRDLSSFEMLRRIEERYKLPDGYFKTKLPYSGRSIAVRSLKGVTASERRRLAWHLPYDFDQRPITEREEILNWVRTVIISGSTEYRRYQAAAAKNPYSIRFPNLNPNKAQSTKQYVMDFGFDQSFVEVVTADQKNQKIDAPPQLEEEMKNLIRFKTATLTAIGYQRMGVWNEETADQKIEHLGLMFGALVAPPKSIIQGLGISPASLTFSLLVFPSVWDWYLQWRENRRGFYTAWEIDMLRVTLAMTRKDTGWLRQNPGLAARLKEIPGLISQEDINVAINNWDRACDSFHKYGSARIKELQRVSRVHRDPFEAILPVLEAKSPVGEYRKITEEILHLMPDERHYPKAAAESVRSFLMLRLGLHLGLRQKNLRQLLVCPRGQVHATERQLNDAKRGQLRWSERDNGWEVFIPSNAFKNSDSSYFGDKPFRLVLPDIGNLYQFIEDYISRHRKALLRNAKDPNTFFVKSVKTKTNDASYCQNTFYEAWRLIIQRYGIYNPYTDRGAIKGLLPHGPHNVRDVLATHILKQTGSYEQASYAIQDTPAMIAQHYDRFLPQDKAAIAAKILNKAWDDLDDA